MKEPTRLVEWGNFLCYSFVVLFYFLRNSVTFSRLVSSWRATLMVCSFTRAALQTRNSPGTGCHCASCWSPCRGPPAMAIAFPGSLEQWHSQFSHRPRRKHQLSKISSDVPVQRRRHYAARIAQIWKGGLRDCDDHEVN